MGETIELGYRPSVGLQDDSQGAVMWLYQSNQTPCMAVPVQADAVQGGDLQICWLSILFYISTVQMLGAHVSTQQMLSYIVT